MNILQNNLLKKRLIDKYIVGLIFFLTCFHAVCNLSVGTISFSSDEFIPLSIAANCAGLDWSHARLYDYYYGYVSLIFFIPFFKIPVIYQNPFLLTQCLCAVNSIFHIIMAVLLYKAIIIIGQDNQKRKNAFMITIISTCTLQVFILGMGCQIESLFVLCYVVVLYILLKVLNDNYKKYEICVMAFFTCVAYANNSRGIVLVMASITTLLIWGMFSKEKRKIVFLFFLTLCIGLIVHKYIVKPIYMPYFVDSAKNTDSYSLIKKFISIITNMDYFMAYIKTILGWIWTLNVSTYGLFIISLIVVVWKWINTFELKPQKEFIYITFILICFIGTFIVSSVFVIETSKNLLDIVEGQNRADILFYARYMVSVLPFIMAVGLVDFFESNLLIGSIQKIGILIALSLLGKVFYMYVAQPINGIRYGINNSVFLSMIQQSFQETYRYGNVESDRFWIAQIIVIIFTMLILGLRNRKEILLVILSLIMIITCVIYTRQIPANRSEYYNNVIDKEFIEYCNNSESETIYVSNYLGYVGQYLMPDKIVYHDQINTQDILIVSQKADKKVDKESYQLTMRTKEWLMYEKEK